jgi:GntR family galactonate operon transcriptional repressor
MTTRSLVFANQPLPRSESKSSMSEPDDRTSSSGYGRGLHGDVVTALGRQIVGGALKPGDVLNMESLEEQLSISRSVLREALRVLRAKGLIEARPKRGTIVRPRSSWNLLDQDVMLWQAHDGTNQQYLRNLEEVRRIIEPQVARIAASRRTEDDLVAMRTALEILSEASGARRRTASHVVADLSFHHAILTATRNDLLIQLGPVMENALRQRDALVYKSRFTQDTSFVDDHWAVFNAISEQSEERAEDAMHALLAQASSVLEQVLASKAKESKKKPPSPSTQD